MTLYSLLSSTDRFSLPSTHRYVVTINTCVQVIATHIADRCAAALLPPHAHPPPPLPPVAMVWDLFCGCGGNALPLARHFPVVVAVDINPDKLPLVRHNAEVHGVGHRVEAVCGDAYDVLTTLTSRRNQHQTRNSTSTSSDGCSSDGDDDGDLAILAPPWGGPGYTAFGAAFDLRTGFPSGDGFDLVAKVATRSLPLLWPVLLVPPFSSPPSSHCCWKHERPPSHPATRCLHHLTPHTPPADRGGLPPLRLRVPQERGHDRRHGVGGGRGGPPLRGGARELVRQGEDAGAVLRAALRGAG